MTRLAYLDTSQLAVDALDEELSFLERMADSGEEPTPADIAVLLKTRARLDRLANRWQANAAAATASVTSSPGDECPPSARLEQSRTGRRKTYAKVSDLTYVGRLPGNLPEH